jgi:hypothetical protein
LNGPTGVAELRVDGVAGDLLRILVGRHAKATKAVFGNGGDGCNRQPQFPAIGSGRAAPAPIPSGLPAFRQLVNGGQSP